MVFNWPDPTSPNATMETGPACHPPAKRVRRKSIFDFFSPLALDLAIRFDFD
jgi:hypothetical protein